MRTHSLPKLHISKPKVAERPIVKIGDLRNGTKVTNPGPTPPVKNRLPLHRS